MNYRNGMRNSIAILIMLPFVWLVTGLFWLPKGASYMGGLCTISVMCVLLVYRFTTLADNFKGSRFLWILGFAFIYAAFLYGYQGYSSRELKALFFALMFLLFFPMRTLDLPIFVGLFTVGAMGVCVTAGYQYYVLGVPRIQGFINPITYAAFAALCFVVHFSLLFTEMDKRRQAILIFLNILLLMALVLTGARGVLLAMLVTIVVMLGFYCRRVLKINKIGILLLLFVSIGVFTFVYPAFQARIKHTQDEVALMAGGNYSSSIGLRLQMWRSAFYSAGVNPLLGLGDAYIQEFEKQYDQGLISKELYEHQSPHYHNQYIDKYIKTGLLGLSLLLLLLCYPLVMALRAPGRSFPKVCIIGVVSAMAISGLTDVPLNHAPIVYCYLFIMTYLLYALKNLEVPNNVSM